MQIYGEDYHQGEIFFSPFLCFPAVQAILGAAAFALTSASPLAATSIHDFARDPTISDLFIGGNNDQPWQPVGGNGDGFLALTYPQNDQHSIVIFPDMENGRLVKAFRFEADVRSGNSSSALPGNGFSVSFATKQDPVLRVSDNRDGFAVANAEESGSRTGLSISLGTWDGSVLARSRFRPFPNGGYSGGGGRPPPPPEYIVVRVDNQTIYRGRIEARNGECANPTSWQTGPRDPAFWVHVSDGLADPRDPGSYAGLCWQPLVIDLDENGFLNVQWKGETVVTNLPTYYLPQSGQFILAGRTGPQVGHTSRIIKVSPPFILLEHGGAVGTGSPQNEHIHLDNIRLATVPALLSVVGPVTGTSCGISVAILDANDITPVPSTIQLLFNSTNVPITTIRQGTRTIVLADMPVLLETGSTNAVEVSFDTSSGTNVMATRLFIVPKSVTIDPTEKASTFDAESSGFTVRTHWLGNENRRGPDDPDSLENAETQLAGRFTFLNDTLIPNQANLTGASNGLFTVPFINFEQPGTNLTTIPLDNCLERREQMGLCPESNRSMRTTWRWKSSPFWTYQLDVTLSV